MKKAQSRKADLLGFSLQSFFIVVWLWGINADAGAVTQPPKAWLPKDPN